MIAYRAGEPLLSVLTGHFQARERDDSAIIGEHRRA
jgi:hypothetical protein